MFDQKMFSIGFVLFISINCVYSSNKTIDFNVTVVQNLTEFLENYSVIELGEIFIENAQHEISPTKIVRAYTLGQRIDGDIRTDN